MPAIQVPESHRAFCTDRAVETAVSHIFNSSYSRKSRIPADVEWDELPQYHRAVLSAYQAQCEYAEFAHELWNAVWPPALKEREIGKKLTARTIAEAEESGQRFHARIIWATGSLALPFDVADKKFVLLPGVLEEYAEPLRLTLSFSDADGADRIAELNLGDRWQETDTAGVASSRDGIDMTTGPESIDVDDLCKAAADAVAAVEAWLPA